MFKEERIPRYRLVERHYIHRESSDCRHCVREGVVEKSSSIKNFLSSLYKLVVDAGLKILAGLLIASALTLVPTDYLLPYLEYPIGFRKLFLSCRSFKVFVGFFLF